MCELCIGRASHCFAEITPMSLEIGDKEEQTLLESLLYAIILTFADDYFFYRIHNSLIANSECYISFMQFTNIS